MGRWFHSYLAPCIACMFGVIQLAATGLDLSRATGFNEHSTRYEGTIIIIKLV